MEDNKKIRKLFQKIFGINNCAQSKLLLRSSAQLFSCYTRPDLAHLAPCGGIQVIVAVNRHKSSSLMLIFSSHRLQYRNGRKGRRERGWETKPRAVVDSCYQIQGLLV